MTLTAAWIATVEKIGPSSEASAESQSCSRRLTVLSGIRCAFNFFHAYSRTAIRSAAARRPGKVPMKHAATS